MKQIPLTRGLFAIVDDEDFEYICSLGSWSVNKGKDGKYYARLSKLRTERQMSRIIMKTPKNMVCDHINGNTLDNRKSNLRNCDFSENNYNRSYQKNNKLKIKNIFITPASTYRVCIKANGKTVLNKNYKSLDEAITERDKALKLYHGEFSNK